MKNEQMVGTRVPAGLVRDLQIIENAEQSDRSATIRRLLVRAVGEWKLEHYARRYGQGQLTLARAAEAAGVTLWEMTAYVQSNKIAAQYDADDLRSDLLRVKARLGKKEKRGGRRA